MIRLQVRTKRGNLQQAMSIRKHRSTAVPRPWLYGRHPVAAALANPRRHCARLVATDDVLAELRRRLGDDLGRAHLEIEPASRAEVARTLPPGAVHQGVALEVEPLPPASLDDACAPSAAAPRVVVLDHVTDPRNVGAALRSAAAFGALAVVMTDRHAPRQTGALAKAAAGALDSVPLVRVANLARALERLKRLGYWCVGLDPAAPRTLAAADPSAAVALVAGAEGAGLRRLTRERCDLLMRLPTDDAFPSLNVAAALAVALYAFKPSD